MESGTLCVSVVEFSQFILEMFYRLIDIGGVARVPESGSYEDLNRPTTSTPD